MTTRIKIEYVHGNKAIEVIDARDASVAATLCGPGDVFEQNVHSDAQFIVRETGDFFGAERAQTAQANATVDPSNTDDARLREQYASDPLPPGAGDDGSNVEDVRVDERIEGDPKNTI